MTTATSPAGQPSRVVPIAAACPLVDDRRVTPRPHGRRARATLLAIVAALFGVTALTAPARAVEPFNVVAEITDQVGALGGRTDDVQDALDRLSAETPLQLFVVFVASFDDLDGLTWANETAIASGLGDEDILMAVGVTDRRYGISVADGIPLTDGQLDEVRTEAIEPALSADDWAGAAIAAADGYRAAYTGTGTSSGGTGGGSTTSILTFVLVGALIAGVIAVIVVLRRRKGPSGPRTVIGPDGAPVPADSPQLLATEDLNRRASSALVAIDDALKTSEQELGFAQAQFGLQATRAFAKTLEDARPAVARAFMLRQQLDDATPESEPQARAMMIEIVEICDRVSDALDDHAEEFDRLRALEARAPQVLDETEQRATEVARRLGPARAQVAQLATIYPAAALASVSGNPDQAERLLAAAHSAIADGRQDLEKDDRPSAVARARVAEDAVAQSVTLLEAVGRAKDDLAKAGERLTAALASISADVADAQRLAPADGAVSAAAAVARQRIAEGQAAREGGDPLAALRHLTDAEAALDAALAPARAADERARRAAALLTETLGRVNAQVRGINDFIETRRGAVGPEPRTRLAEAMRLLGEATSLQATNPEAALQRAQHAEHLAQQAQSLAQRDVSAWEQSQRAAYSGPGAPAGRSGPSAGSLILGGIILDSVLRGGSSRSGGFGGGSIGGSSRRSGGFGGSIGRSAGSFGGGGTRGRRGGGGRF